MIFTSLKTFRFTVRKLQNSAAVKLPMTMPCQAIRGLWYMLFPSNQKDHRDMQGTYEWDIQAF